MLHFREYGAHIVYFDAPEWPSFLNVKVFMTTSRSDAKTIVRSFFGGCEGYLVKPVEPDEVRKMLHEHGLLEQEYAS